MCAGVCGGSDRETEGGCLPGEEGAQDTALDQQIQERQDNRQPGGGRSASFHCTFLGPPGTVYAMYIHTCNTQTYIHMYIHCTYVHICIYIHTTFVFFCGRAVLSDSKL